MVSPFIAKKTRKYWFYFLFYTFFMSNFILVKLLYLLIYEVDRLTDTKVSKFTIDRWHLHSWYKTRKEFPQAVSYWPKNGSMNWKMMNTILHIGIASIVMLLLMFIFFNQYVGFLDTALFFVSRIPTTHCRSKDRNNF